MCAEKFQLVSLGARAEGLACTDPGARTPIGASGNLYTLLLLAPVGELSLFLFAATVCSYLCIHGLVHTCRTSEYGKNLNLLTATNPSLQIIKQVQVHNKFRKKLSALFCTDRQTEGRTVKSDP